MISVRRSIPLFRRRPNDGPLSSSPNIPCHTPLALQHATGCGSVHNSPAGSVINSSECTENSGINLGRPSRLHPPHVVKEKIRGVGQEERGGGRLEPSVHRCARLQRDPLCTCTGIQRLAVVEFLGAKVDAGSIAARRSCALRKHGG